MNYSVSHLVHREHASNRGLPKKEAREILQFVCTGRHLDIGLLSRDNRLRSKLDSFMKDHRPGSRLNWREGAAPVGGVLVLLVTAWLIWAALAEAALALAETA